MADDLDPAAFYFWTVTDERSGKPRRASYRMQPATALERFPDATPNLSSKEIPGHIGGAGDLGRSSGLSASAFATARKRAGRI